MRTANQGMTEMRLVIAEDSGLLRAGLVRLLVDAGIDVVGEAASGEML